MCLSQDNQGFSEGGTTFATTGRGVRRCNIAKTSSEIAKVKVNRKQLTKKNRL